MPEPYGIETAGSFGTGNTYIIVTVADTDFTLIGAVANRPGVVFEATGEGQGSGTARRLNVQMGRIGGKMLAPNLIRNGFDLEFDNNLLYLNVNDSKVSINTDISSYDLYTFGATQTIDLIVDESIIADGLTFTKDRNIFPATGDIIINPAGKTVISTGLTTGDLLITNNQIRNKTLDSNIEIRPFESVPYPDGSTEYEDFESGVFSSVRWAQFISATLVAPGNGTGSSGGFLASSPGDSRHVRFTGSSPRSLTSSPQDFSNVGSIRFLYITGDSSNGGENVDPNEFLQLQFWDGAAWTTVSTVDPSSTWSEWTYTLDPQWQTTGVYFRFYQTCSGSSFDNIGLDRIIFDTFVLKGSMEIDNALNVNGDLEATGNITIDGSITFGDSDSDNVTFASDINSDIIPNLPSTYRLGTPTAKWGNIYTNNVNGSSLQIGFLGAGGVDISLRQGNLWYVSVNGSDENFGDHQLDPFKTIEKALEVAESGDTVLIFPGEYEENVPLVVPQGVTVKGTNLRNAVIVPPSSMSSNDIFHLNGESYIESITIKNFYYDDINNTGYAFRFAPGATITSRSPYIQNITVITNPILADSTPADIYVDPEGLGLSFSANSVSVTQSGHSEALVASWVGKILVTYFGDGYPVSFYTVTGYIDEPDDPGVLWRIELGEAFDTAEQGQPFSIYPNTGETIIVGSASSVADYSTARSYAKSSLPLDFNTTVGEFWTCQYGEGINIVDFVEEDPTDNTWWKVHFKDTATFTFGPPIFTSPAPGGEVIVPAGRGAYIDGTEVDSNSNEASMLFHSCTFIVPGADAITMTNGVRVEWLNSFTYFANRSLYATRGIGRITQDGSTRKYGAEIRSIGSASIYGTYGAVADGLDTLMYLINHNFAYIGVGTDTTNDNTFRIEANEVVMLNDGKIYFQSQDHRGKFKVGSNFFVDFDRGTTSIDVTEADIAGSSRIIVETQGQIVVLDSSFIDTGSIAFSGNIISNAVAELNIKSVTGQINLDSTINISKDLSISGDLSIDGEMFLLGNQYSDSIKFEAEISHSIIPAETLQFDLGSDTKRWSRIPTTAMVIDDILINGNFIETSSSNADLELRTNGTGRIIISNSVLISNDLSVGSDGSQLRDVNITGSLDHTGNITQTGDIVKTGNVEITGDLSVSNDVQLEDIKIFGNVITTTESNSNLRLVSLESLERRRVFGVIRVPSNDIVVERNFNLGGITTTDDLLYPDVGFVAQEFGTYELKFFQNNISSINSNVDIDLRATGDVLIGYNDVELVENLTVQGSSDLQSLNITGTITHQGNKTQTGNVSQLGDYYIGSDLITDSDISFENISITNNKITTTLSSSNLDLIASGTGKIIVPQSDVLIENDLTNDLLISSVDISNTNSIQSERFKNQQLLIEGNLISATTTDSDIELRSTARTFIPNNNVEIAEDLTVLTDASIKNVNVIGSIVHTGDRNQTGNYSQVGDFLITGSSQFDRKINFENIQIEGNVITTLDSNSDLELRADGFGIVNLQENVRVIDDLTADSLDNTGGNIFVDNTVTTDYAEVSQIDIYGNVITTTGTDTDLELTARGGAITYNLTVAGGNGGASPAHSTYVAAGGGAGGYSGNGGRGGTGGTNLGTAGTGGAGGGGYAGSGAGAGAGGGVGLLGEGASGGSGGFSNPGGVGGSGGTRGGAGIAGVGGLFGGGGGSAHVSGQSSGGGGGLRYVNDIPVSPGQTYTLTIGAGGPAAGNSGAGGGGGMRIIWGEGRAYPATNTADVGDQQVVYDTPGVYEWTVPEGVTSVCVVCVGGGASGWAGTDGGNTSFDTLFFAEGGKTPLTQTGIGAGGGGTSTAEPIAITIGSDDLGEIFAPNNNVQIDNNLTVSDVTDLQDTNIIGTITHSGDRFNYGNYLHIGVLNITGKITTDRIIRSENIQIDDNVITTTRSNSDLELTANSLGEITVLTNDVQLDQNLQVQGTTNFENLNITGLITQTGDVAQTGNFAINGEISNGTILIEDDFITTVESNSSLILRASGSGRIVADINDVVIQNDLYDNRVIYSDTISAATSTVTSDRFATDNLEIYDNVINATNGDLLLASTKNISWTSSAVIENDLTVNGHTYLKDLGINGSLTQTGNRFQIGDYQHLGVINIDGNIIGDRTVAFESILINDNFITTTDTNDPLTLKASGTGKISVPANDVLITNDLSVIGNIEADLLVSQSNIDSATLTTGDITFNENQISTALKDSDLEISSTREILIPESNVVIDNDLTVAGITDIDFVSIAGTVTHTGDRTQLGDHTQTGNTVITGTFTSSSNILFEDIKFENNIVTTTVSNSDLELKAAGTGQVLVPNKNVVITNDLTVEQTLFSSTINTPVTVTSGSFTTGDINITDNEISTTIVDSDLILQSTRNIVVQTTDLEIDNNLTVENTSNVRNVEITGDITHTGNKTFTGTYVQTGDTDVSNNLTVTQNVNFEDIRFVTNTVTTSDSNSNLELAASSTGSVVFDVDALIQNNLRINGVTNINDLTVSQVLTADRFKTQDQEIYDNRIQTTNNDLPLKISAINGSVNAENVRILSNKIFTDAGKDLIFSTEAYIDVKGTNAVKLPSGATAQKTRNTAGDFRFNTTENVFEGYYQSRIGFGGIYSDNKQTNLTAHPFDNILRFKINGSQVGYIVDDLFSIHGIQIDEKLSFQGSTITTLETNGSINLVGNSVVLENSISFNNQDITNILNTPLILRNTGTGYVSFAEGLGLVIPVGDTAAQTFAEIGDLRYNTDINDVEVFNGTEYQALSGDPENAEVDAQAMGEITNEWSLILG